MSNANYIPPAHIGAHVGHNPGKVMQNQEVTRFFTFTLGLQGFSDTNILVSLKQKCCVGVYAQYECQTAGGSRSGQI